MLVSEIVNEYRKMAKSQPDYFKSENSVLLIYWKEDKVWYYCTVLSYDQAEDKFNLKYDDGVQEAVKLWTETFITHAEYLKIKSKLEPPREKYEKAPVGKNEFSSNYWYQNQNSQQQVMVETKKRGSKRGMAKDTNDAKIGKIAEKLIIDEFTIIRREYNASDNNSSLSGDEPMEEEDDRMGYERITNVEHVEKGRNYMGPQIEMNDNMHYPQDIMAANDRYLSSKQHYNNAMMEQERQDYNRAKMHKRGEKINERAQGFSNEDNLNHVIKVGPFETNKVPHSLTEDLTDVMAIEKFEADQIYTPKNFNYIVGSQQTNTYSAINERIQTPNNQVSGEREYQALRPSPSNTNASHSSCKEG